MINVMLLMQSNLKESSANMVFSKVRTWSEKLDREDNNNTVKQEILRTPPRCTFSSFSFLNPLVSFLSILWRQKSANMHMLLKNNTQKYLRLLWCIFFTFCYLFLFRIFKQMFSFEKKYHFHPLKISKNSFHL